MNWQRAHWLVGVLALVAFLLSGQYMLRVAGVSHLDSVPRLIFRSRHLFILVAGVANLALSTGRPLKLAQKAASLLILVAPFLLTAAFFLDPARGPRSSELFHFAMYGVFTAGVLIAFSTWPGSRPPNA